MLQEVYSEYDDEFNERTYTSKLKHYVITKGGLAPNVIPEEAEVYYY